MGFTGFTRRGTSEDFERAWRIMAKMVLTQLFAYVDSKTLETAKQILALPEGYLANEYRKLLEERVD